MQTASSDRPPNSSVPQSGEPHDIEDPIKPPRNDADAEGNESDSSIGSGAANLPVAVYEKRAASDSTAFQVFAAFAFMTSAMSLLLLNKAIMHFYPYTFTVIFLQDAITCLLALAILWYQSNKNGVFPKTLTIHDFMLFLPAMCFFLLTLVTGLEVFKYISVVTFIALRYTTCYFSYFGELFLLGRKSQNLYLISLVLIGIGAGVYASSDLEFSKMGYVWLAINIVSHSAFALYVKWVDKADYNVLIMSLFNNLQTLIPLLICSFIWKELPHRSPQALAKLTKVQHLILWSSCVAGFCISVTGFYAQKLFSATAWTIQSNLNKIPTILLSVYFFHSKISWGAGLGAFILLMGGLVYSLTALHYSRKEKEEAQKLKLKEAESEHSEDEVAGPPNKDHYQQLSTSETGSVNAGTYAAPPKA